MELDKLPTFFENFKNSAHVPFYQDIYDLVMNLERICK